MKRKKTIIFLFAIFYIINGCATFEQKSEVSERLVIKNNKISQSRNENNQRGRVHRQVTNNWRNEPATQSQQQQNVPYKTFYVTRACEWKSNLFVPKLNDIYFAQLPQLNEQHHQQQNPPESSVVYETSFNTNNHLLTSAGADNSNQNNQQQRQQMIQSASYYNQHQQQVDQSRTILFTDSKALILALPIVMSQSFAGYEPACSIRLIVPKNMRILAKLTSRRLTFAQEQLEVNAQHNHNHQDIQQPSLGFQYSMNQQQQAPLIQSQLWLNVSQNQFVETEQRIIETGGNILGFRFLLDRFENKQLPDTRFQVVLTAFQTLGENSDLASGLSSTGTTTLQGPFNRQRPSSTFIADPSSQFICDQQRLISANLACDGFKNCQDGQDEEPATCSTFRQQHSSLPELPGLNGIDFTGSSKNQIFESTQTGGSQTFSQNNETKKDTQFILVRFWQAARDTNSVLGFLLGFILVLILLSCCTCCFYFLFICWKKHFIRQEGGGYLRRRQESKGSLNTTGSSTTSSKTKTLTGISSSKKRDLHKSVEPDEFESLSEAQNIDNRARLAKYVGQQQTQRLQSILKKPSRPVEPPPAVPTRLQKQQQQESNQSHSPIKRGALSSSLSSSSRGSFNKIGDFKPTPAKRLTRPTRPVPSLPQATTPEGYPPHLYPSSNVTTSQPQQQSSHQLGPGQHSMMISSPPSGAESNLFSPSYMQSSSGGLSVGYHTQQTKNTSGNNRGERITTYHYSSGSTRYSDSYLQRLAESSVTTTSTAAATATTTTIPTNTDTTNTINQTHYYRPEAEAGPTSSSSNQQQRQTTKKNNTSPSQSSLI